MGKMDTLTTEYLRRKEIFADLLNTVFYGGRRRILAENLIECDTQLKVLMETNDRKRLNYAGVRDILYAVCLDSDEIGYYVGVENQTDVDYAAPSRLMLYDASCYHRQIAGLRQKGTAVRDKIHTVPKGTTLCAVKPILIHWGLQPWDGPKTLHDMLNAASRELLPLIPNYTFTMVEPVTMPEEQIQMLQTDLGAVFQAIHYATDKVRLRNLVQTDERFKSLDSMAAMLLNELLNLKLMMQTDIKEKVNMCQAWQEILEDERNAGRDAARDEYEPKLQLLESENETIKSENETIKSENEAYKAKIENVRNNLRAQGLSEDEIRALFEHQ